MTVTPETVELIVKRVLECLGTPAGDAPSQGLSQGAPGAAAPADGIRIQDQVVTQALLAETVNGCTRVRIAARAVLTPSARDFVRQRGIEVVREPVERKASVSNSGQLIVSTSTPQIIAAVEGLGPLGIGCALRLSGSLLEATAQATSALCRAEAARVVVVTDQPERVACLANRNELIRAAAVVDAAAALRLQKTLRPNLLAVDPSAKGAHELKILLKVVLSSSFGASH